MMYHKFNKLRLLFCFDFLHDSPLFDRIIIAYVFKNSVFRFVRKEKFDTPESDEQTTITTRRLSKFESKSGLHVEKSF